MKHCQPTNLTEWINWIAGPSVDPWPSEKTSSSPVDLSEAIIIDPTYDFKSVSDEWTDDESNDEEQSNQECDYTYKGKRDSEGRFHIYGTLTFDNGDIVTSEFHHGVRQGEAVIISERNNISRLCGTYVDGKLQGKGTLVTADTTVTSCFFQDGIIHGPVRQIGMKKFREFRRQLLFVGRYKNGRPSGQCWEYREGGGFIYGCPDKSGKFTGDNIAFIYPDHKTALLGKFSDGVMVSAQEATVSKVIIDNDGIAEVAEFTDIHGPSVQYSKATKTSMGSDLTVADPYEKKWVVCKQSDVTGAGEGLFAAQDIQPGTIVAFYNGIRLPYVLGGPKEVWDTSGYKIYINADFKSGERMDIPEEYISIENYCATLGHKMNHCFTPNCYEWFFDHPRFGVIPCERTTKFVAAGEELFLDYEYDPYNCPRWFRLELMQHIQKLSPDNLDELAEKYRRFRIDDYLPGGKYEHEDD